MAKKSPKLADIIMQDVELPKDEAEEIVKEVKRKWTSIDVTMKRSEIEQLNTISDATDATRNSIMRYAIVQLLKEYEAGTLELPTEERKSRRVIID